MTINAMERQPKHGDSPVSQGKCQTCKEQHVTHNPLPQEGGFMERLSDLIGSTRGIWILAAVEAAYMVLATAFAFDPYPFAFLTLVLSLIALQFSQIIIVVQNRQGTLLEIKAQKERDQVAQDLDLDLKAYALLAKLHDKLLPEEQPASPVTTGPLLARDRQHRPAEGPDELGTDRPLPP